MTRSNHDTSGVVLEIEPSNNIPTVEPQMTSPRLAEFPALDLCGQARLARKKPQLEGGGDLQRLTWSKRNQKNLGMEGWK